MKKIILIVLFLLFSILTTSALAAPAPTGIAINEEKEECTSYWAGDEFTRYELPSGWESYYLEFHYPQNISKYDKEKYDASKIIETPIGNCNYSENDVKSCCEQLGYDYVSEEIAEQKTTPIGIERNINHSVTQLARILFLPFLVTLSIALAILKYKKGVFLPFAKSYLTKGLSAGFLAAVISSLSYSAVVGPTYFYSMHNNIFFLFWFPLINLAFFCLIGLLIGFIVKKIRKE